MEERIQGDRYLIRTKIGDFEIVAAELETTYDKKTNIAIMCRPSIRMVK